MMLFTLGLAGLFVFLFVCCQAYTVNKVLLHIDNMLILVKLNYRQMTKRFFNLQMVFQIVA